MPSFNDFYFNSSTGKTASMYAGAFRTAKCAQSCR